MRCRKRVLAPAITLAVLTAAQPAEAVTSYCLRGRMADGTGTRPGSVANNSLPLGTRVSVWPKVFGHRRWVVRDRIGYGTDWDFWNVSCGRALAFAHGPRGLRITVGWPVWRMALRR
jgi:hypothetical protein